jgi:hypothetical protein
MSANHGYYSFMNIAMTSYQRPEMTYRSLSELLKLEGVQKIHLFVDGLRSTANNSEKEWREQTISVCEKMAKSTSKIELIVWKSNIGIVENSKRSFTPLFENFSEIIVIEEDVQFNQEALDFLRAELLEKGKKLVTSYSHSHHNSSGEVTRKTLFPTLWGAGYSHDIFELSLKIHKDKKVDRKLIAYVFESYHDSNFVFKERLKHFWNWYFNFAVNSGRHPDVLLQYASWLLECFATAPVQTLSEDLSRNDFRGMNPRSSAASRPIHSLNYGTGRKDGFCRTCERLTSRIEPSAVRHYASAMVRRFS